MTHTASRTEDRRVVVVDYDHDEMVLTKTAIEATERAEVVGETTSYALAGSLAERHRPDYVFMAVRQGEDQIRDPIERIRKARPGARIIMIGDHSDADEILLCFRAGADEYLARPLQQRDLLDVFERLKPAPPVSHAGASGTAGEVIAVMGSRGGCGATTMACNLAYSLAKSRSTLLADLHFGQGDLSVYFDIHPKNSLMDLADSGEQIDATLVESVTARHKCGVSLLLQPFDQVLTSIPARTLTGLLEVLRGQFDFVLLDAGPGMEAIQDLAGDISRFVLLTAQDLPSLFLAQRKLEMLQHFGVEHPRVSIVINAFSKKNPLTLKQAVKVLDRSDLYCVRDDRDTVMSAINQGVPILELSRFSKAGKDIEAFADLIANGGKPGAAAAREGEGLLQALKPMSWLGKPARESISG